MASENDTGNGEVVRAGAAMVDPENHLEQLITRLRRRPTSVLAPGGHLRSSNSVDNTAPSVSSPLVTNAQHASSHSSTPSSNSVVQALGDAFRVPIPGYSAPASIGDSTWRTLGFDGTTVGAHASSSNTGSGSGTRRGIISGSTAPSSAPASLPQDDEVWTSSWGQSLGILAAGDHDGNPTFFDGHQHDRGRHENADYGEGDDEGGILVIPSFGDRTVENDVHALLEVHGIASRLPNGSEGSGDNDVGRASRPEQRPRPRRTRIPSYRFLEEEEEARAVRDADVDADGEVDADVNDTNTGSSHGDYEYYPPGGSLSSRRRRRMGVEILGYSEHEFRLREDEQGVDDRMDVDMDMDMGGGAEENCESEESEDEEVHNSTRTRRSIRQSSSAGPMHSSFSSRRYGTSSNTGASTSIASTGTHQRSSIPFPKGDARTGQNQSRNFAQNYGYGSLYGYYDDLDLAGICFDPSGERMYVAGVGTGSPSSDSVGAGAVVEWSIRGAEKRWWVEEEGWK